MNISDLSTDPYISRKGIQIKVVGKQVSLSLFYNALGG